MERFTELSLVLKNFPYQERDRIAVCLTENKGKITGLAKGAIHSRRYGGSLDFLSCAKISFVQKPHAELARIEEAVTHHEFRNIHADFSKLTAASFSAEICLKLMEPHAPAREVFSILSNFLFYLDAGLTAPVAINAFLCKVLKAFGYPPSLLRCVSCNKPAHEIIGISPKMFWYSDAGGMVCSSCTEHTSTSHKAVELDSKILLLFHNLTTLPFKQLDEAVAKHSTFEEETLLYRVLTNFLHHHLPGIPNTGFKSWKLMNEVIYGQPPLWSAPS